MSDGFLDSREADSPSPAQSAEQRQSTGQLRELMGSLPDRQQEVLRLKFQEGLSYREIAEVTGQSVTNVGFLIHRALRTLREQLQAGERQPARSMP